MKASPHLRNRIATGCALALGLLISPSLGAHDIPQDRLPLSDTVLTVATVAHDESGAAARDGATLPDAGSGALRSFDLAALSALPVDTIRTTTVWTSGLQEFRGVRLSALLDHLGILEGKLTLTALNGYLTEIEVREVTAHGAMIAFEKNGAPMSTRDKGPLWLIFPYDHFSEFRNETIYAQSIWHLDRIEVSR